MGLAEGGNAEEGTERITRHGRAPLGIL